MIAEILQTSFTMMAGLTFFLVIVSIYPLYNKKQNTLFRLAITLNLCMLFVIAIDFYLSGTRMDYIYIPRRITSFLNFGMAPFLPLLLWKIFREKPLPKIAYIPAALNIALCFFSMFFGFVFDISVFNTYGRGIFFNVPLLISFFYMIMMIRQPVKHLYSKTSERIFLIFVIIFLILSVAFETLLSCRFLNWNASAISVVLYYLLLSIQSFIIDPLTGAYNRTLYNKELSNFNGNSTIVITMIDINNFKQVNDVYGHDKGDQYLTNFSSTILEHLNKSSKLYRIGGDEFVIFSKDMTVVDVEKMVQKFKVAVVAKQMAFSYGISMASGAIDIDEALKAADNKMYLDKKTQKRLSDEK